MHMIFSLISGLLLSTAAVAAPSPSGSFEDAANFFARSENLTMIGGASYSELQQSLARQFNDVCGDTFCAGDYSNLTPLSFDCSVHTQTKLVGQCVWAFAGSYSEIDPSTGRLHTRQRVFACDLGFRGTSEQLGQFLQQTAQPGLTGTSGLRDVTIPGQSRNLMDVLVGCL